MRFLFVYQDYAVEVRQLKKELAADDVTIIIARKRERCPNQEEMKLLQAHKGAPAAACEIDRHYRKSIENLVSLCYEPKKFRFGDLQLKEWLAPTKSAPSTITWPKPSEAFREACQRTHRLVVHPNALKNADDLPDHRWRFAKLGADVLADYADGRVSGALSNLQTSHGVQFAANGQVSFGYTVQCAGNTITGNTSWHLKEGDYTTRIGAARIYFGYIDTPTGRRVLVFYVGPHPENGEHQVSFILS